MARATEAQIRAEEKRINRLLGQRGYHERVFVQWAYGQPRVHMTDGPGLRNLSPRDRTGAILQWLYAFYRGLSLGVTLASYEGADDDTHE